MDYDGILLIDKPSGWTSHDVVAKIRNVLRTEISKKQLENSSSKLITNSYLPVPKLKVGHTGTLDPLATGLMIIVVGSYCKRASEFSKMDKSYELTMKLGETSTTGDNEGKKQAVSSRQYALSEIQASLKRLTGEIMQTPPIYSAIKVNGQRAYKLARAGQAVKLEPRKVTIYRLELVDYNYPFIKLLAKVSSGTYIRSLVEDIAQQLGTGAYMSRLQRSQVADYKLDQAIKIEQVSIDKIIKV